MVIKRTLQVAVVSELVGFDPSGDKQVPTVLSEVQGFANPHLQVEVESSQMLLSPIHASFEPHLQTPSEQVSESPVQASFFPHLQTPALQVSEGPLHLVSEPHLQVPSMQVSESLPQSFGNKHSEKKLKKLNFEIKNIRNTFYTNKSFKIHILTHNILETHWPSSSSHFSMVK